MPPTALRRLAAAVRPDPSGDPHLVRAFLADRDEAAFAELVRRHGPMVLGVCRRVLGHREDAEDAFQAAFLVLARKAGSVRGANLAGWLYAVAARTARGVRVMRDRRRRRDQESGVRSPTEEPAGDRSLERDELSAVVDEVLSELPEHYRLAVVLCELQGRSRKAAAAELGIPEGTLSSRLAAARRQLADRLSKRGITAPAAALAGVLVPAAGPVAADLARAAVRSAVADGVASAVAVTAADGVVKALLVAKLKAGAVAVGLAAGFVGGVVVATVPGGTVAVAGDPEPAPAPRPVVNPADLVKQLGDGDFVAREAAAKGLRGVGQKAVPALEAAARDPNPEAARRSRELLKMIRADALADLVKSFDPAGTADPDHPIWRRYRSIAGADRPARELFAAVIADPRRLRLLAAAETDPGSVGATYAHETYDTYQAFRGLIDVPGNTVPGPGAFTVADLATLLYLGTYPGTSTASAGWATERSLFLTRFEPGLKGPTAAPLGRVFVAWLARREDRTTLEQGFARAVKHGLTDVLPVARRVAADADRPAAARCAALPAVARFGTPADVRLFEPLFDDNTELTAYWSTGIIPPGSKHDGIFRTRVKDYAVGMALLLHGEYPAGFGFPFADPKYVRPPGRPDVAEYQPSHFAFQTTVEPGSLESAHRDAAHKTARAWLAEHANVKADPPAKGSKVWDHFKTVVGDGKPARELFGRVMADPKSRELLEKAAAGDKDLYALYLARRDELNALSEKPDPAQPGTSNLVPVPLDAVAGWLLLGTLPGTKGDDPNGGPVQFLDTDLGAAPLAAALKADGPLARPMRTLVAAWLATRGDEYSALKGGLELALRFDLPEALPTARRVVKGYPPPQDTPVRQYFAAVLRSLGVLAVGKYGAKADLPLLAPYFDDPEQVMAVIQDSRERRPGKAVPIDGKDYTTMVGDVALGMAVRLAGGDPQEFGFLWPVDAQGKPAGDPFRRGNIGFLSAAEREAAHTKARAWLDRKK